MPYFVFDGKTTTNTDIINISFLYQISPEAKTKYNKNCQ
jgi:hypothetical protein